VWIRCCAVWGGDRALALRLVYGCVSGWIQSAWERESWSCLCYPILGPATRFSSLTRQAYIPGGSPPHDLAFSLKIFFPNSIGITSNPQSQASNRKLYTDLNLNFKHKALPTTPTRPPSHQVLPGHTHLADDNSHQHHRPPSSYQAPVRS
jgi:hypothetical protein